MPDLFVIDVSVNIPKGKIVKRQFADSSDNLSPRSPSSLFKVELYEILGLFQTASSKCPSNLDCGLFPFSFFQSYKSTSVKKEKKTHKQHEENDEYIDFNFNEKDPNIKCSWGPSDAASGLCIGKSLTASKKKFEFRILGSCPSSDYLESKLTQETKQWIGLKK